MYTEQLQLCKHTSIHPYNQLLSCDYQKIFAYIYNTMHSMNSKFIDILNMFTIYFGKSIYIYLHFLFEMHSKIVSLSIRKTF